MTAATSDGELLTKGSHLLYNGIGSFLLAGGPDIQICFVLEGKQTYSHAWSALCTALERRRLTYIAQLASPPFHSNERKPSVYPLLRHPHLHPPSTLYILLCPPSDPVHLIMSLVGPLLL